MSIVGGVISFLLNVLKRHMKELQRLFDTSRHREENTSKAFYETGGVDGIGLLLVFLVGWMFFSIIYHVWG